MTEETKVVEKKEEKPEATRRVPPVPVCVPDADIRENDDEIVLEADMPGVDGKSADVSLESNILTIQGKTTGDSPRGHRLVREEHGVHRFRREFELSNAIDGAGITARLKNGVLRVQLPKGEGAKARKIEIGTE
jgi:HSP20 family protein